MTPYNLRIATSPTTISFASKRMTLSTISRALTSLTPTNKSSTKQVTHPMILRTATTARTLIGNRPKQTTTQMSDRITHQIAKRWTLMILAVTKDEKGIIIDMEGGEEIHLLQITKKGLRMRVMTKKWRQEGTTKSSRLLVACPGLIKCCSRNKRRVMEIMGIR